MKKILHIIATPRGEASRTLKISESFLDAMPSDYDVETLNLFETPLPDLTVQSIDGKYHLLMGNELPEAAKPVWDKIIRYIEQFKSADIYLLSVPMWNFNIPYVLKHYIDMIVQPKYLFQYTAQGVEGLMKNKKMIIITSRGGDYSADAMKAMDLQEPYLKLLFGFVGITDISFIHAQPMDAGGEALQQQKLAEAQQRAIVAAKNL